MYDIVYLPIARQDITEILLYISDHLKVPNAAMELLQAFDESISLLKEFPYAHRVYRPVRPMEEEYRLLPVKNYIVFYVVQEHEKRIEIKRVLYARMDLTRIIK